MSLEMILASSNTKCVGHAWNTKQQGLSYTLPAYGRVALARHALFVFFVLFFDIFTLQQV